MGTRPSLGEEQPPDAEPEEDEGPTPLVAEMDEILALIDEVLDEEA
jgi:hypothetical protein